MKHGKNLDEIERDERDVEDMRQDNAPISPTTPQKCSLEPRGAKKGHKNNRQR